MYTRTVAHTFKNDCVAWLQLAAAACIKNDKLGKDRDERGVQKLFDSHDGGKALDHAVQIEAKELLAQPVV